MIDKSRILEKMKKGIGRKIRKDQLLILLLVGILLLVITVPVGDSGKKEEGSDGENPDHEKTEGYLASESTEKEYVSNMERKLESILSQMEGAGEVQVMITLKESSEKVIEKDVESSSEHITERDSQGGERTTVKEDSRETTIHNGSGGSDGLSGTASGEPYVRKEIAPRVEGVVVVASGGNNAVVRKNITEAVQALFGTDTHKIRIVKKE